jgi:hypothetical protein
MLPEATSSVAEFVKLTRTSGHCLGTFQTAKLCFGYNPPPNGSVSHYHSPTFFSLSLVKLTRVC